MNEGTVGLEITDGPHKEGLQLGRDVWFHLNGDAPPEFLGSIPTHVSEVHRGDGTTVVVRGKTNIPGIRGVAATYDPQTAKGIIYLDR